MPYTLKNALGDELAFLESSCDVFPLHSIQLALHTLVSAQLMDQLRSSGTMLPASSPLVRDICRTVLNLSPESLEADTGEEAAAQTVATVVQSADDIFFRTLPLIRAENPLAERLAPSCVPEQHPDMAAITAAAVAIYAQHLTGPVQLFVQRLNELTSALAAMAGTADPEEEEARSTLLGFVKKTPAFSDEVMAACQALLNEVPVLARAAEKTREALKADLREREISAYAEDLAAQADTTPQRKRSRRRARPQTSTMLSTVLWQRWQAHADTMAEYLYSQPEASPSPLGSYMAFCLATILDKVARHPATSAMMRKYAQKILKAGKLVPAMRDFSFTRLASLPSMA